MTWMEKGLKRPGRNKRIPLLKGGVLLPLRAAAMRACPLCLLLALNLPKRDKSLKIDFMGKRLFA
jgi:hypothetical protein